REPTAVIEVLVSSRVVPEKAAALARLGVPWIEVQADATLADPDGWTPAVPLTVVRTSIDGEWRCAVHAPIHENMLVDIAERRAVAREAERHARVLCAARVVDVYRPVGARDRFIYPMVERFVD